MFRGPAGTWSIPGGPDMDWTTPTICEIAVGMEVTSYLSAAV
jgi:coenzyme PQQ precursor peptide PqqA